MDCLTGDWQGGGLARGATEDGTQPQSVAQTRTSEHGNRDCGHLSPKYKCLHYMLSEYLGKDMRLEFGVRAGVLSRENE